MAALDMQTLKNYVTADDESQYAYLPDQIVSLNISHSNLTQKWPEIRINLHATIGDLKAKLYNHGGTKMSFQKLLLRDPFTNQQIELENDNKKLGFYGVRSGMQVHIIDEDPFSLSRNGGLEDVSLVKKYVMKDEDYNKVENSLRNYKKKKREEDPFWTFLPENRRETKLTPMQEEEKYNQQAINDLNAKIGARVEVSPGARRGTIAWIGKGEIANVVEGLVEEIDYCNKENDANEINSKSLCLRPGYWIGVIFDEPVGKNDGSLKGKRYFECQNMYGGFIRPDSEKIKIGDFPELDLDALDLSSDDDGEFVM